VVSRLVSDVIKGYYAAYPYRASETESCLPEILNFSVNSASDTSITKHQRIAIYGGIVGITGVIISIRAVLCYLICFAAARSLHSKMFRSILRAPVLFYDINPVGKCVDVSNL